MHNDRVLMEEGRLKLTPRLSKYDWWQRMQMCYVVGIQPNCVKLEGQHRHKLIVELIKSF
jgi:hypothetical protein